MWQMEEKLEEYYEIKKHNNTIYVSNFKFFSNFQIEKRSRDVSNAWKGQFFWELPLCLKLQT